MNASKPLSSHAHDATGNGDPEIRLLIPEKDDPQPEISIVVPALNEQITIADFVAWCHEGLRQANIAGEILIVDSSTDRTAEIALAGGARVLKTPKRGLGRAYIDAIPYIRGRYVLCGDCDCTYDFRHIAPFVEKLRQGYQFVMGSRFTGYIEPGAMPPLHRYFGTPLTTGVLNMMFGSRFSDIHCGMRGMTRDALQRMDLRSQSWEYASEMVLKSVHMQLRTTEVPIRFLKDREGRLSHHARTGWFSPWQAGWINLRAMFIYGPNFFLFKPGLGLFLLGLVLTLLLATGPRQIGAITLSLHFMLLGLTATVLGLQCVYLGILAQIFFDYPAERTKRWLRRFAYTRTVLASAATFLSGIALCCPLVLRYVRWNFRLPILGAPNYMAVLGLMLIIISFMTFTFTLLLHATQVALRNRS